MMSEAISRMVRRVAVHLRTCKRGLASAQGHVVTQFNRQLELFRITKLIVNAMVHIPDAQGSVGENAKRCETLRWLAFLQRSSLDKNVSSDYHSLAVRHQYLWMKVDDRELDRILSRVEDAW